MELITSYNHKKIIFEKYLKNLDSVSFTYREIDIIAAIIHNRGEKKIASLLNISPRTVSSHIHNIMRKISCCSREQIIDFIEKSGKILIVKEYYIHNLIKLAFENQLSQLKKELAGREFTLTISHKSLTASEEEWLAQLTQHLNLINITLKTTNSSSEAELCVISNNSSFPNQNNKKIISLLISDTLEPKDENSYIDFSNRCNYYDSFFKLINKILGKSFTEKYFQSFSKEFEIIKTSWQGPSINNIADASPENISPFRNKNKLILILGLMTSIIILCFGVIIYNNYLSPIKHKIISELHLPHDNVLLKREDILEKIDEKLLKKSGIQVVALVGAGGAGKTIIARQYARSHNAPIIWEINAENKESLISSFEQLAYSLCITEKDNQELEAIQNLKDEDEREKKLFSFINKAIKDYPDWLIVYNEVKTFKDIRKYFPYDSQVWGNGKIIITTRDSNIGHNNYIPNQNVIMVGELTDEEKLKLFTNITGENSSLQLSQNYMEFIRKLPPFPLDLNLAAYYIKEEKIPLDEYLTFLSNPPEGFLSIQEIILNDIGEYTKTRYDIITLSVRQIINENKEFEDLLLFLSLIDIQDIPKDLFIAYKDDVTVSKFMHSLRKFSLINESSNFTFSIHQSTQAMMREYLIKTSDPKIINQKYQETATILADYILDETVKHNYKSFALISHIEMFLTHHNELFHNLATANLKAKLGVYYFRIASYSKAEEHLQQAFNIYKQQYGIDHVKTAWVLSRLGVLYRNMGNDKKAKEFLEKALIINEKYNGKEHIETIRVSTYLGSVYRSIGDYQKAKTLLEQAFYIYKETYGAYNNNTGWVAAYLGCVYKCLGDYKKAKDLLELAFNIYKKHHGFESTSTGWVSARLGNIYLTLGNYKQAQELLEQSLNIYEKYDGENSVEAAWCLIQLGKIYKELGDNKKAFEIMQRGVNIYSASLEPNHIIRSWADIHISSIYCNLGNHTKAKELLDQAYINYKEYFGAEHTKTAGALRKIGKIYKNIGDLKVAEEYLLNAARIFNIHKHNGVYLCYEHLAEINLIKNKKETDPKKKADYFKIATDYLDQALEIALKTFPNDSPALQRLQSKIPQNGS